MNPSTELLGLVDAMEKSADLRYSPLFGSNHDYPKMAPLTQQQKHALSEFSRKLAERARNFPLYPAFNDDPFDFAKWKRQQPRTLFGRPFEYRASTVKRPLDHRKLYC